MSNIYKCFFLVIEFRMIFFIYLLCIVIDLLILYFIPTLNHILSTLYIISQIRYNDECIQSYLDNHCYIYNVDI